MMRIDDNDEPQMRLTQMDTSNIEYRLAQLESERLPRRVAEAEIFITQLQGEVTAVKEIARGIGVKLDAGIEKLSTNSTIEMNKMQTEQAKSLAFVKGVVWVLAGMVGFIGLLITLAPAIRKVLGE